MLNDNLTVKNVSFDQYLHALESRHRSSTAMIFIAHSFKNAQVNDWCLDRQICVAFFTKYKCVRSICFADSRPGGTI